MLADLRNILSGLAQLRHADVVRFLSENRERRELLRQLRALAKDVRISEGVVVVSWAPGRLSAGEKVQVREGTVLAFGDDIGGYGNISIGAGTWIGQYNNLRASGRGGDIRIGVGSLLSQFCTLVGSQHGVAAGERIELQVTETRRGIVVGDDVWLGAGAVVLPGVEIGNGAVVGANSVVTRSIPANEIWAGVPAKKIGERQ